MGFGRYLDSCSFAAIVHAFLFCPECGFELGFTFDSQQTDFDEAIAGSNSLKNKGGAFAVEET